ETGHVRKARECEETFGEREGSRRARGGPRWLRGARDVLSPRWWSRIRVPSGEIFLTVFADDPQPTTNCSGCCCW
ncbi:unnamed protein product, partial [Laminaria digitata]